MSLPKWFPKSKTFWFGAIWLFVGAMNIVLNQFGYDAFQPSDDLVSIAAVVNGAIIIILRFVTKQPVAFTRTD